MRVRPRCHNSPMVMGNGNFSHPTGTSGSVPQFPLPVRLPEPHPRARHHLNGVFCGVPGPTGMHRAGMLLLQVRGRLSG